jgi:hypothetical protein
MDEHVLNGVLEVGPWSEHAEGNPSDGATVQTKQLRKCGLVPLLGALDKALLFRRRHDERKPTRLRQSWRHRLRLSARPIRGAGPLPD